jgi:hypothetical protein
MWNYLSQTIDETWSRLLAATTEAIPGLLALFVAVLVAIAIGLGLSLLVGRILRAVKFDSRMERSGLPSVIADWSPVRSPTMLVSRLVFWTILLCGLLVGASALDPLLLQGLGTRFGGYLPNVLAALLVLAAGTIVARFVARSVLISAVNLQIQSARLLSLGVKWLVLVFTGALVLDHLAIGRELVRISFAILFGGIVLSLAIAVGLGSKDIVSRSWERQQGQKEEPAEEPFRHL